MSSEGFIHSGQHDKVWCIKLQWNIVYRDIHEINLWVCSIIEMGRWSGKRQKVQGLEFKGRGNKGVEGG